MEKLRDDKIKRWMQRNVTPHIDNSTGEINYTSLAEEACQEFDLYGKDYSIPEELFELALEIKGE